MVRTLTSTVVGLLMAAALPASAHAAYGELDGSFASGCVARVKAGTSASDAEHAVAVTPDGGVVVAGEALAGGAQVVGISKLRADGTPDPGWAGDGTTTVALAESDGTTQAQDTVLAVQPDGKVLLALSARDGSNVTRAVLLRLNADGSVDASFPRLRSTILSGSTTARATGLALLPGGNVLVGGLVRDGGIDKAWVRRYRPDGSLDGTYGPAGGGGTFVRSLDAPGTGTDARSLLRVQAAADGSAALIGDARDPDNGRACAVARVTAGGELDARFNGGVAYLQQGTAGTACREGAVAPDGSVYALGGPPNLSSAFVARLRPDGSRDPAWTATACGRWTRAPPRRSSPAWRSSPTARCWCPAASCRPQAPRLRSSGGCPPPGRTMEASGPAGGCSSSPPRAPT